MIKIIMFLKNMLCAARFSWAALTSQDTNCGFAVETAVPAAAGEPGVLFMFRCAAGGCAVVWLSPS